MVNQASLEFWRMENNIKQSTCESCLGETRRALNSRELKKARLNLVFVKQASLEFWRIRKKNREPSEYFVFMNQASLEFWRIYKNNENRLNLVLVNQASLEFWRIKTTTTV